MDKFNSRRNGGRTNLDIKMKRFSGDRLTFFCKSPTLFKNMAKINPNGRNKSSSSCSSPKSTNWIPAKNAERERTRVRSLRNAFKSLQSCLPSVPPDTKLSKLDILILATNYITILMQTLDGVNTDNDHHYYQNGDCSMVIAPESDPTKKSNAKVFRPIKKWPMRSRLYSMIQLEHSDEFINKL